MRNRLTRIVAVSAVVAVGLPLVLSTTVFASLLFLPLPASLPEAKPLEASRVSRVYDADGNEIGVFRRFEQNIPVRPEDIPEILKKAVISAEDRNFYKHGGVDIRGTVRALWADIRGGAVSQGGSTITQQYVKNAYVGKERTISRKVREAVLASQLDRQVDKDEILFKYLSTIYLGNGAYGVGAASETYFRKPVSELNLGEAAMLAGLIPAPSRYEPRGNIELAEQKRQSVLRQMLGEGYIDEGEYEAARVAQVYMADNPPPPGPATFVYPARQEQQKYPYFVDYVRRYLEARYGQRIYTDGLRVETTLDGADQDAAERHVRAALNGIAPPIEMSLVSIEPLTGYVKAFVGGRDFYAPGGQVNLGLGGSLGMQPGSSFKPFVLAAAFNKGVQPTKVYSAPSTWAPPGCRQDNCVTRNYGGAGYGSMSLREATWRSVNTVYVQLIHEIGIRETAEMARKLGVLTVDPNKPYGTSLALGAQEVTPIDMAGAFAVFAGRGMQAPTTGVLRVTAADGTVLEDNTKPKAERVIPEPVADNVTDVLKGAITSGTGKRADIGRPAAGKTGTTDSNRAAWFVGYTPTLSTAIWMGNRERPTPLERLGGFARVDGGTIPARTWGAYMKEALADVPVTEFNEPAPLKPIADDLDRRARGGLDPGTKRPPAGSDAGGPYVVGPPRPQAEAPATTTTTRPDDDDGFGGGDDDDDDDDDGSSSTIPFP